MVDQTVGQETDKEGEQEVHAVRVDVSFPAEHSPQGHADQGAGAADESDLPQELAKPGRQGIEIGIHGAGIDGRDTEIGRAHV